MPGSSPQARRTGIVEIASRLKISPSTVSRALRPETAHLVHPERRKEILELADQLHFSPNPGARILRKGVNSTLMVVVPFDENIFFSEFYGRFLSGAIHAAGERGWDVHISTLRRQKDSGFRETLQHMGLEASGMIYLGEPLSKEDLNRLRGLRRPLVLTKSALPHDVSVQDLGVPVVGVDNLNGARSAASLLLQLGHRRIGLIMGPSGSRDAHERKQGYLEVLAAAGCTPPEHWIHEGPFNAETGRAGMQALLAGSLRPTAFCCANDEIAFGALDAARSTGLRCPDDVSIVGFDDGPWATICRPALTTIRQPLADLAERAVSIIVEAATHPGRAPRATSGDVQAGIVIRESTGVVSLQA